MNGECPFEISALHMFERADFDDTGIIDQDVECAEMIDHLFDRCPNLLTFQQVTGNSQNVGAILGEFISSEIQFSAITSYQAALQLQPEDEMAREALGRLERSLENLRARFLSSR